MTSLDAETLTPMLQLPKTANHTASLLYVASTDYFTIWNIAQHILLNAAAEQFFVMKHEELLYAGCTLAVHVMQS